MNPADLIGPVAALALALVMLGLFYTGRILPRNTVPREDLEAALEVNASLTAGIATVAAAVNKVGVSVELIRKLVAANGAKR